MSLREQIIEHFPLKTPREGQVETIEYVIKQLEDKGKQFMFLEAPTGAGKSVIAATLSRMYNSSYYLTIQKILQDQLSREFGEYGDKGNFFIDLKGRNSYECTYKLDPKLYSKDVITRWESEQHNCAEGHCRISGKSKYDHCIEKNICEYYSQVDKAKNSNHTSMNFSSFLHQTCYTHRFKPRELLILDEGHNIESQLMNFISLSISDKDIESVSKIPTYNTPQEYAEWINDQDILNDLNNRLQIAINNTDPKKIDYYESLISKLKLFLTEMENEEKWVVEHVNNKFGNSVKFKPIFVIKQAHDLLFKYGVKTLIMSATILNPNVMRRSLGIDKEKMAAKRLDSKFPVENRRIHFIPSVKPTGGKNAMQSWKGDMLSVVNDICDKHKGEKGIIHTHNFYIAELLVEESKHKNRMLFQKNFLDKSKMLKEHEDSEDSIIVAPAMHEGLDLKNDLSRFQIVCKMPFPNFFEDKQLAARKEIDDNFYVWLTSLKLVQSVGRSIRSAEDWASTYIIDQSFGWWYNRYKSSMIPKWFSESVIMEK